MNKIICCTLAIFGGLFMTNVNAEEAIFAMGCFWCGESEFRDHETHNKLPGITSIRVGYAGGTISNPTYENHPGYKEAVKIAFDPNIISYSKLLDIFWHNIDPFDDQGQFCDKGFAYTAVIFYASSEQQKQAEESKLNIEQQLKQTVNTQIIAATTFHDAEEYHQDYAQKNPTTYKFYRWSCGRDKRLEEIWRSNQLSTKSESY